MSDEHLNDLERRLAHWLPAQQGLDIDAMLFAAGRASVRRSPTRFVWPAIAACLAIAVGILGQRISTERIENQVLLARLNQIEAPSAVVMQPLSDSSYLAVRRAWERDPDGEIHQHELDPESNASQPILRAGERNSEFR
jgi:hypothetical protein